MALVDTTVWIDFLRHESTPAVARLRRLLLEGDALSCPVVVQEILQGARDAVSLARLRRRLRVLP